MSRNPLQNRPDVVGVGRCVHVSFLSRAIGTNDQGIPTHHIRTLVVVDRPGPGRSIGCRNTRLLGSHSDRSIRLARSRPDDYHYSSPCENAISV